MKISVYYRNDDMEIFDTESLTSSDALTNNVHKNVLTKYYIGWGDFLKHEFPSHLNLYIYYYRKDNDKNSRITNPEYLDKVLFFNNDKQIYKDLTSDQVKQMNKTLPYGALECGTWFTLVPVNKKNDIMRIDIDNETKIYRIVAYDELIDISKYSILERQYLDKDQLKETLDNRILHLYNEIEIINKSWYGTCIDDPEDIAKQMGLPYSLIRKIQDKTVKIQYSN